MLKNLALVTLASPPDQGHPVTERGHADNTPILLLSFLDVIYYLPLNRSTGFLNLLFEKEGRVLQGSKKTLFPTTLLGSLSGAL